MTSLFNTLHKHSFNGSLQSLNIFTITGFNFSWIHVNIINITVQKFFLRAFRILLNSRPRREIKQIKNIWFDREMNALSTHIKIKGFVTSGEIQ
jgi:hypothetical protein